MTKGRFFRALVCFLVISCLMFSYIALPSRAFAFAEVAIPALALVLMYLILQTGFIPPPDITIANLDQLDKSFRNWYGDLDITFRNPDDPWPDDLDDEETDLSNQLDAIKDAINNGAEEDLEQTLKISDELLTAFKLFTAFCIGENTIRLLGEEAPEGYAYYNWHKLPVIPDDLLNSYTWLVRFTGTEYYAYVPGNDAHCFRADSSDGKVYVDSNPSDFTIPSLTQPYHYASIVTDPPSWPDATDRQIGLNWGRYSIGMSLDSIIWTNTDLYYDDGTLALAASAPSTLEEVYLEAVAILGETAQGIQDGTKTSDDLLIPQYVNVAELFANATTADDLMENFNQISQELQDGTRDYNEFAQSVIATNPGTGDNAGDNTGSDSGTDDNTGSDSTGDDTWNPPQDPGMFTLDLQEIFPFCIPFDLYAFLSCLNAAPVAPVISWELASPGGRSYPIEIDLSPFNSVAQLLRRLQLLLFIVGLAIKTRDLIKG